MSAAYYDLYAEQDTLFVAKLNILTPEGPTAILKIPSPNPSGLVLYTPPELRAIGVATTTISSSFVVVPTSSAKNQSSIITPVIELESVQGDHNVVISKQMPLIEDVLIPGNQYVYEFVLIFNGTYNIRMLQGKFNYTKTLKAH